MSRMIQVRNVPDALHRTLKIRATMAGMSLSDYLRAELQQIAERPTLTELRERIHHRAPVRARVSAAHAVRAERNDIRFHGRDERMKVQSSAKGRHSFTSW